MRGVIRTDQPSFALSLTTMTILWKTAVGGVDPFIPRTGNLALPLEQIPKRLLYKANPILNPMWKETKHC